MRRKGIAGGGVTVELVIVIAIIACVILVFMKLLGAL